MQTPNPWLNQKVFIALPITEKNWQTDDELKAAFGIELAKECHANPFIAACEIFKKETHKALYASKEWLNDPVVLEAKENYKEVTAPSKKLLDKEEFAARLLTYSEEKLTINGNELYALEGKDRIAALKLYGETMGFINNKTEINNNINNNNRFMEIKFVEPEKKENVKTIEHAPVEQEENILENSPIKLKLVG